MDKINGYKKEEVKKLIRYIENGINSGKSLSSLFESYGNLNNRAKGSVRNFYYKLLSSKTKDKAAGQLLENSKLSAGKIVVFNDEDTRLLLRNIIIGKNNGNSVRGILNKICLGDEKLMLRYQNKYRNILKKQPKLIEQTITELSKELGKNFTFNTKNDTKTDSFAMKRLQFEINDLYDRLGENLKKENALLKERLTLLEKENFKLKSFAKEYFEKNGDSLSFNKKKEEKLLS